MAIQSSKLMSIKGEADAAFGSLLTTTAESEPIQSEPIQSVPPPEEPAPTAQSVPTSEPVSIAEPEPTSPVGIVSSDAGVAQVNEQEAFLNETAPEGGFEQPVTEEPVQEATQDGAAVFTNQEGQEAQFSEEQLQDPKNQAFIEEGGYVLSKTEFALAGKADQAQIELDQATQNLEGVINDFDSLDIDNDPAFKAQASGIRNQFAKMREDMKQMNFARKRALETLGFVTGATQYAGAIQFGIEGEELSQAGARMAEITRQENAAVSAARAAFKTGKFEEYNAKVNAFKDLRQLKIDQLSTFNNALVNLNDKIKSEKENFIEQQDRAQEQLVFRQGQEERLAGFIAPNILTIGEGGEITFDTDNLIRIAEESNINPLVLKSFAEKEIRELNKLDVEQRKADLDRRNTESQIGIRESVEKRAASKAGRDAELFPFELEAKRNAARGLSQSMVKTSEGQFNVTFDKEGNIVNRVKVGELSANEKAPSTVQSAAAGFANRMEQSIAVFENLFDEVSPLLTGKLSVSRNIPEAFKNTLVKQQEQAERNFINAVLRRESGAAIADSEFESAALQYFPQKGDDETLLEQKRLNRQQVLGSMITDSGGAYSPTTLLPGRNIYTSPNEIFESDNQEDKDRYQDIYDSNPNASDGQILQIFNSSTGPKRDASSSKVNATDQQLRELKNGVAELASMGRGTVTGINGSSLWKWGLDFVLSGGKGAFVPSPFAGQVIEVFKGFKNRTDKPLATAEGKGQNGGFGNQVKIRLDDGSEIWVSHLDDAFAQKGSRIAKGQILGTMGNTGSTLGETGTHLDLTMKNTSGEWMTARQVAALLGDTRIT